MTRFLVLTLFPQMIYDALAHSILKRAAKGGVISIECVNIRDFAPGKHKQTDDAPYGGGAGMVMMPGPICEAVAYAKSQAGDNTPVIYMSPKGGLYRQADAQRLSALPAMIILCGHYEGVDQRAIDLCVDEELSIGDYILTGGEIAAMAVIDSVSRLVPGVLNKSESYENESFSGGLLEYPQYTRPALFRGVPVPEALLSGNHKKIAEWRYEQALIITEKLRPDLMR
ncbi:MAG: tRNA (guanosine(37)-N1)-methyltransferase TrmD [Clostridiales bacterium]|jgi:tRNA (guanine37-N1)-methyltransferase|nr:tRNA (guanosine(37)-N1)-methyltransferase TrmD [Clostridiales bacterium]